MISLFNKYTNNLTLIKYYNEIDASIIQGNIENITYIYNEVQIVLDNIDSSRDSIDYKELYQFVDYYKAVNLCYDSIRDNLTSITTIITNLIIIRHPNFSLINYRDHHYTFLELRALFTCAVAISKNNNTEGNNLLLFIYSKLGGEDVDQNNYLLTIKILLNLATNFYIDEQDDLCYKYSNLGIIIANKFNSSFLLGNLFLYRGLSEFFKGEKCYIETLKCAKYAHISTGNKYLADEMIKDIKKINGLCIDI